MATEFGTERMTTEFVTEWMATEFATEQITTEFVMDQMAMEFATEQNRYGICYKIHCYEIVMVVCYSWNTTDRRRSNGCKIAMEL